MFDGAQSHEQGLIAAIVKQAVDDLSSNEEEAVYEANQFFQSQSGGWAQTRRLYFHLLGLDEDAVLRAIKHRLTTPERPAKKWSAEEVYEILPTHPFRGKEISKRTSISYAQMTARLQHLMDNGRIVRVDRGIYVRDDCYDDWVDEQIALQPEPEPVPPTTPITEVLKRGPMTIREIGFAFDGGLCVDAIRLRLHRALETGTVIKHGAAWRLAA